MLEKVVPAAIKAVPAAKKAAIGAMKLIGPELVAKVGSGGKNAIDTYKNRVKIPNLKDVPIEDAVRNINELNLLSITAIAQPNVRYADVYENVVVNSEPKFGKKVDPKTTVKIYYVTNEVIEKSIEMEKSLADVFKLPRVVGLDIYEAREDLEESGLRVTLKLESPNIRHIKRRVGQVTRVTYPDNKKLTPKQKKGERVWLYYVDENVIKESITIKNNKLEKASLQKEKITEIVNNIPEPFKRKKRTEE